MKAPSLYIMLLALITMVSCRQEADTSAEKQEPESIGIQNDTLTESIAYHPMTMAAIYQQLSAEKYALEYQAYKLAQIALENDLDDQSVRKERAVILDIDETVLDNSPYQVQLIYEKTSYPDYWGEWVKSAQARPLAGVKNFLENAAGHGLDIFYITNRHEKYRKATLKNLQMHKLPQSTSDHLLMKTKESSKEKRREKIRSNYHISLLIGDNLNDFSSIYEEKTNARRKSLVDKQQELIGTKYIILPNTTYGDWESAIYDYDYSISPKKKHELRIESLQLPE